MKAKIDEPEQQIKVLTSSNSNMEKFDIKIKSSEEEIIALAKFRTDGVK